MAGTKRDAAENLGWAEVRRVFGGISLGWIEHRQIIASTAGRSAPTDVIHGVDDGALDVLSELPDTALFGTPRSPLKELDGLTSAFDQVSLIQQRTARSWFAHGRECHEDPDAWYLADVYDIHPDYLIQAVARPRHGSPQAVIWQSDHHGRQFRASSFYRRLFPSPRS
jgi:hypothetical protein